MEYFARSHLLQSITLLLVVLLSWAHIQITKAIARNLGTFSGFIRALCAQWFYFIFGKMREQQKCEPKWERRRLSSERERARTRKGFESVRKQGRELGKGFMLILNYSPKNVYGTELGEIHTRKKVSCLHVFLVTSLHWNVVSAVRSESAGLKPLEWITLFSTKMLYICRICQLISRTLRAFRFCLDLAFSERSN